jgi:hypothetical protein
MASWPLSVAVADSFGFLILLILKKDRFLSFLFQRLLKLAISEREQKGIIILF